MFVRFLVLWSSSKTYYFVFCASNSSSIDSACITIYVKVKPDCIQDNDNYVKRIMPCNNSCISSNSIA